MIRMGFQTMSGWVTRATRISRGSGRLPKRLQPRRAPTQSRSIQTVEAVVTAATRILVEKKWEGLSMQDVATLAGVSPGTLYQYFPDKHALVAELVERVSLREVEFQLSRFASLPEGEGLLGRIDHLVRGTLEFQRREGRLMRVLLECLPHLGRHALLVERVAGLASVMRGMLEERRAEVAHDDLDLVVHVIVNAVHSLTHDGVLARPASLDDETLAREIRRLIAGYVRPAR
ncbi:MAG: TetR/AcrR family transcriptional regulator [Myxococcaceae bacterium]|nr:TetR/AcrR family transcriptional regulator [Myxococcaceae bacterium]